MIAKENENQPDQRLGWAAPTYLSCYGIEVVDPATPVNKDIKQKKRKKTKEEGGGGLQYNSDKDILRNSLLLKLNETKTLCIKK